MINILNPVDCCGCTACASICAHDAITMQPDALGFLYPKVDETLCVECGLCEKVCAFNNNYNKTQNLPMPNIFGARHKNMAEVETSRSGAIFIAISDYILDRGGVVYGVGYADHFRVVHKRAITKVERNEFKGSKYVQSDLTGIFRQVKADLQKGVTVLFSGTPCQTSGLASFIGSKLSENLYLVDIVCHGVPGPYLWRDYIAYLEKKQSDEIVEVNFRDKEKFGWIAHHETFKFKSSGDEVVVFSERFYKSVMFRYSCGNCHFCNIIRPSDITIADFWGWEKTAPSFNQDNKGVNLVLVNTKKGQKVFDSIQDNLNTFVVKLENALQSNLQSPTKTYNKRQLFEQDYEKYGFEYVQRKYMRDKMTDKIISMLKSEVKVFLEKIRSSIN